MQLRSLLVIVLVLTAAAGVSVWAARTTMEYGAEAYRFEVEHPEAVAPPDAGEKTEFAFARLRYPSFSSRYTFYSWGIDSPKSERQFVMGLRRLTRIHTRSVEEIVNLEDDHVFVWPWMYAVEVGHWDLTDLQCKRLREYLLRGGFLMVDDFHGTQEWAIFMASMARVFPERPVVEIQDNDEVFHVLYDLGERVQVPGLQYLYSGRIAEKDGFVPRWRGIYDDEGRLMVFICHNQDYGDAWEWADYPQYPEKYASQAYRLGINAVVYAMTH
jgi:Domain of unknown function (DUF4159)